MILAVYILTLVHSGVAGDTVTPMLAGDAVSALRGSAMTHGAFVETTAADVGMLPPPALVEPEALLLIAVGAALAAFGWSLYRAGQALWAHLVGMAAEAILVAALVELVLTANFIGRIQEETVRGVISATRADFHSSGIAHVFTQFPIEQVARRIASCDGPVRLVLPALPENPNFKSAIRKAFERGCLAQIGMPTWGHPAGTVSIAYASLLSASWEELSVLLQPPPSGRDPAVMLAGGPTELIVVIDNVAFLPVGGARTLPWYAPALEIVGVRTGDSEMGKAVASRLDEIMQVHPVGLAERLHSELAPLCN